MYILKKQHEDKTMAKLIIDSNEILEHFLDNGRVEVTNFNWDKLHGIMDVEWDAFMDKDLTFEDECYVDADDVEINYVPRVEYDNLKIDFDLMTDGRDKAVSELKEMTRKYEELLAQPKKKPFFNFFK
jgi:hypothetical protein